MTVRDHLFLIVSDRSSATSEVHDLGHDVDRAMDAYRARERELAGRDGAEVVLVGSASLDSLRRTHSSYFGASDALGPILTAWKADGSPDGDDPAAKRSPGIE